MASGSIGTGVSRHSLCVAICKKAKLQARIKPTALCSAIDKENSIEFLLDVPTLLIQLLHGLC